MPKNLRRVILTETGRLAAAETLGGPANALSPTLDVSWMQYGQVRDLFEVVLFIEGQDSGNAVVFHDYAVDHVADPGVTLQNSLSYVVEEFREVVVALGTHFDDLNLETP
jgi:hypothetical protein